MTKGQRKGRRNEGTYIRGLDDVLIEKDGDELLADVLALVG